MDKQFKKGCVFIIGGSGGIGRACVQRFAEAGAKIVFTYHQNIQAAQEIKNDLGDSVDFVQLSNQNESQVHEVISEIASNQGGINTIINAAGFNIPQKYISEITPELWRKVIDEDVNGFFNIVSSSLPFIRESKGSYVFISSAGLFKYPPGDVLSVAPKATIEHTIKELLKKRACMELEQILLL